MPTYPCNEKYAGEAKKTPVKKISEKYYAYKRALFQCVSILFFDVSMYHRKNKSMQNNTEKFSPKIILKNIIFIKNIKRNTCKANTERFYFSEKYFANMFISFLYANKSHISEYEIYKNRNASIAKS